MEIDKIRRKPESNLSYRRGRARNYPRFRKLIEKFNETGEPMNLEDVVTFMGLTHHTLRNYAKEMNLRMLIMKDDEGTRWVSFKELEE